MIVLDAPFGAVTGSVAAAAAAGPLLEWGLCQPRSNGTVNGAPAGPAPPLVAPPPLPTAANATAGGAGRRRRALLGADAASSHPGTFSSGQSLIARDGPAQPGAGAADLCTAAAGLGKLAGRFATAACNDSRRDSLAAEHARLAKGVEEDAQQQRRRSAAERPSSESAPAVKQSEVR